MENAVSGICFNSGNELFLALYSDRNISIAATFLKGVSETAFLNRSFLIRPPGATVAATNNTQATTTTANSKQQTTNSNAP